MNPEFRAQQSWIGCNGLVALFLLACLALAGLGAAVRAGFRLVGEIERAASSARLTDSPDA